MNKLTLRYKFDPSYYKHALDSDDFGWLSMDVETEKFKGGGGMWVQWQDVREFGESLARYPIEADDVIAVQWGFNMQEGDDLILRIQISPKGSSGELLVSAEIADYNNNSCRVRVSYRTTYAAVDIFRHDIARMMSGASAEAVLFGH